MKVQYTYCGLECDFELKEEEGIEYNPIPILEAIIKLHTSLYACDGVSLVLKSTESEGY